MNQARLKGPNLKTCVELMGKVCFCFVLNLGHPAMRRKPGASGSHLASVKDALLTDKANAEGHRTERWRKVLII